MGTVRIDYIAPESYPFKDDSGDTLMVTDYTDGTVGVDIEGEGVLFGEVQIKKLSRQLSLIIRERFDEGE